MSRNVDLIAVAALLLAAALIGGIRDLVAVGLQTSNRLIRIENKGSRIFALPARPLPPMPPLPRFQRD